MKEEYISKEQFCKECHVGKQTALWLIQSGLLPAINTMRQTGRYLIAKSDIACYLRNRELEPEKYRYRKYRYRKYRCQSFPNPGFSPDGSAQDLRSALEKIWIQVPDVLRCHEVQAILGYEEGVITRWRKELGPGYIKVSQTIYYPKKCLIDFLLSPQSQAQYFRSNKHIQLLRRIKNVEK